MGISIDSRRTLAGDLFFALTGDVADGHDFVDQALALGAVGAVVRKGHEGPGRIAVDEPLVSLQRLAAWWRRTQLKQVVAITGSNGKTIVKDALTALCSEQFAVAASPGSYNSQVGVPLAVLAMPAGTELAIVEVGVSVPGDMAPLASLVSPDAGVFVNVGLAHIGAFETRENTANEKARLFVGLPDSSWVVAPPDPIIGSALQGVPTVEYGSAGPVQCVDRVQVGDRTRVVLRFPDGEQETWVGTRSPELVDDVLAAVTAAHQLGVPSVDIARLLPDVPIGPTRLEVWRTPSGITLVNDSHSADPISVAAALRAEAALGHHPGKRVFVFGGMTGLGDRSEREHRVIGTLAAEQGMTHLVIEDRDGPQWTADAFAALGGTVVVTAVDSLGNEVRQLLLPGDTVLVKGPRRQGLDAVARTIWESVASKRLHVDLGAIQENVRVMRRACGPDVRVLAMLKAWAYGTEFARVATWLQQSGVDWIGVSAADEGVLARRAGVHLPILVTLLDPSEIDKVVRYRLTPVVYSLSMARELADAAARLGATLDVHLQVDTGFGRLGAPIDEFAALITAVQASSTLRPTGLMTHLSCADDPSADAFTQQQLEVFDQAIEQAKAAGLTDLIHHAAATSGAARIPASRHHMVRLGLGLYGVYPSPAVAQAITLELALGFVGNLLQVATFPRGHAIGYGASYRVDRESQRVGIVGLGYNDGVPWRLSNRGEVLVGGRRVAILGRVSMDSMAVDLTNVPDATVGDDVLVFGRHGGHELRPEDVADVAGTIPYELLVKVDTRRVQRLFSGD
jgi:Alr-MurF fusion protein